MTYHSQNLNEGGWKLWHGRAWLNLRREVRLEWLLGRFARGFALTASFGCGDYNDGIMLHACIPWLFSIYLGVAGVRRCRKKLKTGFAIHDGAFWIYPLIYAMETTASDPWYRHCIVFNFPWDFDWYSTEVLDARSHSSCQAPVVWSERKGHRKPFLDTFDARKQIEADVSIQAPYTYALKQGVSQRRLATVHCIRMEWRTRWWPLIPRRKVRTSIQVAFSEEVGEGTGSWKGGCTGCGYDMLPGETMLACLRRMEAERKFDR